MRKRLKLKKFFKGIVVNYKRPQPSTKNLYYIKMLSFLKTIDQKSQEILICYNNQLLEGGTTNVLCVKNNILYIPKNGCYFGITLGFIKKYTKRKIIKTNILLKNIKSFEEILIVGSGKGVIALNNIPQLKWHNKSQTIYNELQAMYNLYLER